MLKYIHIYWQEIALTESPKTAIPNAATRYAMVPYLRMCGDACKSLTVIKDEIRIHRQLHHYEPQLTSISNISRPIRV